MSLHNPTLSNYAAVILAAGLSRRMGTPKMLLPWAGKTIIEQTVANVEAAGIGRIVVVLGGFRERIELLLKDRQVDLVFNPDYENGEMLVSFKCGLRQLGSKIEAVFMVLGDQPGISPEVFRDLFREYRKVSGKIIIPSYEHRRGHPWLVDRQFWQEIMDLQYPLTLRDFLRTHQAEIRYVNVESSEILVDLDTLEDYQKHFPKNQT